MLKNFELCKLRYVSFDFQENEDKVPCNAFDLQGNKLTNGCPVCDKSCPARQTKPDEALCWNQHYCQRSKFSQLY